MAVVISVDSLSLNVQASIATHKTDTATTPPQSGGPFVPSLVKNVGLGTAFVLRDGALFVGSLAPAAVVDLNLSTVKNWWQEFMLTQPVTAASKIKLVAVSNDSPAGSDAHLRFAPSPALGFLGPLAGTTPSLKLPVGMPPLVFADGAGFADDLTTNHSIRLTNLSATTAAVYRVLVGGSDT